MAKERFPRRENTDEEAARKKHIPARKMSRVEEAKLREQGIPPEAAATEEAVPASVPGVNSRQETTPVTDSTKSSQEVDVSQSPDVDVSQVRNPFLDLESPDLEKLEEELKIVSDGSGANGIIDGETSVAHKPNSAAGRASETLKREKKEEKKSPYDVILRYRKMGVPDADIAANLQERGVAPKEIEDTFRFVEEKEMRRKRASLGKAIGNIDVNKKLGASLGQIETKPGTAWKEPEQDHAQLGREPQKVTPTDEGPFIQVETKIKVEKTPPKETVPTNVPGADEVWSDTIPGTIDSDLSTPSAPIDATRKESRERFAAVMERARERFARENVKNEPKAEDLSAKIKERSAVLDTEAIKMGKAERIFRSLGEKYNKLGWKSKLAIGGVLVLGAAGVSTVSTPLTMLFGSLIATQRALGMAGVFIHLEKHLQSTAAGTSENFLGKREWYQKFIASRSEKTRGNIAAGLAMVWSYGMGAAIAEGVREFDQSEWGQQVHNFLRHHYPFGSAEQLGGSPLRSGVVPQEAPPAASAPASAPEVSQAAPAAAPPAEQATATSSAATEAARTRPPILEVSVNASKGHGYEWMVKRIWEQLQQQQGVDPSKYPEGSDIRKLLETDAGTINKIVHQIASDPDHGFYNSDGTSVRIDPTAELTVGADGRLHLTDAAHQDVVHAADDMRVTPAYHLEGATAVGDSAPLHETVQVFENSAPPNAPDASNNAPTSKEGSPDQIQESHAETAPAAPAEQVMVNPFGIKIPAQEAHLYADTAGRTCVYGGDAQAQNQLAYSYFMKNHNTVIFRTETSGTCTPLSLQGGAVVAGPTLRTGGFFGFFSRPATSGPQFFFRVIK